MIQTKQPIDVYPGSRNIGTFFLSCNTHKDSEGIFGECINVMVQTLRAQDGTLLPGLTMQNMYTELRKGSKKAVVVVQNNTTYPQTL